MPYLKPAPKEIIYTIIFFGLFLAYLFIFLLFIKKKEYKKYPNKDCGPVNIVIPAKNEEKRIKESIESLIAQDYIGKINIVVVNDASTDKTKEVVETLIKKYKKLKNRKIFLLNKKRSRGKKAYVFNFGARYILNNLKGDYIGNLDADTVIEKDAIRKALNKLKANTVCVIGPIFPKNREKLIERLQSIEYTFSYFFRDLLTETDALAIAPAFALFKKEFFVKYGLYDTSTLTEDFEIALRVKSKGYNIEIIDSKVKSCVPSSFKKLYRERIRWGYGEIQNLIKYSFLMSGTYGFFGLFFIPVIMWLGIGVLFISFLLMIYLIIKEVFNFFYKLSLGWRIFLDFSEVNLYSFTLSITNTISLLIIFSFILSFFIFIYSHKYRNEKIRILDYIFFIFPYALIITYFRLEGIIRYLFKIKTKW